MNTTFTSTTRIMIAVLHYLRQQLNDNVHTAMKAFYTGDRVFLIFFPSIISYFI
jgi:hypothetical protein